MQLTPETGVEWLAQHGMPAVAGTLIELGGGVSNRVILAPLPRGSVVLKQSLAKLQVEREWLSDITRIFREAAAMRWLEGKVRGGHVPRLLAEDPANYIIAMESAPAGAEMWKTRLFHGEFDRSAARSAGTLLGSIIAATRNNSEVEQLFGDQTVFDQLRIDPYYRFTAARHPEVADYFYRLIATSAARRVSLVHGDWSPKNLLVSTAVAGDSEIWAIDWEVVHYGDPSYDVAFLFNHLLLKTIAMPHHREALADLASTFCESLNAACAEDAGWLESAALEHLPALLLARVDGKSTAEYLDAEMRAVAWKLGLDLISRPPHTVLEAFSR